MLVMWKTFFFLFSGFLLSSYLSPSNYTEVRLGGRQCT